MAIQQLSVFLENKPGTLVNITHALRDNHIDIRAMSIADSADFGILRLIVSDVARAGEALRAGGAVVSVTDVIALAIPDTPGALTTVAELLGEQGINVEYMYAFANGEDASAVLKCNDAQKAADALKACGFDLYEADEAYHKVVI